MTRLARVAGCGVRSSGSEGGEVVIRHNAQGAYFTGLQTCGSVWACPTCHAKIQQRRAGLLETGVAGWLARGFHATFVTGTVPHGRGDALADTLAAVAGAWSKVVAGAGWKANRATYAIEGYCRTIEMTYGHANGWHPHVHAIVFTRRALTPAETGALGDSMFGRWATAVERAGLGRPHRNLFRAERVTTAEVGRYVAKVALEMTRHDLKVGRRGDRWTPFEIGAHAATGEAWAVRRWHEYEAATRGHKALTWASGMARTLGLFAAVQVDQGDDELVADDENGTVLYRMAYRVFLRAARRGRAALLLDAAEDGDPATIAALLSG